MRKLFTLTAFCLATLALNAQESADYVIRTLTFEDADFKGGALPHSAGATTGLHSSMTLSMAVNCCTVQAMAYPASTRLTNGQMRTTPGSRAYSHRATAPGATIAEDMPYPITLRPISKPMAVTTLS